MKYLDTTGLSYFWDKVKGKIPTNISELTNDSGFITEAENPIKVLTGTESNPIYLRELQTGLYILNGICKPFEGSTDSMTANSAVTHVAYFDTVTAVQIFYPPYNQVQYFEVYDSTYTSNAVSLNDLTTKQYVDDLFNSIVNGNEVSY